MSSISLAAWLTLLCAVASLILIEAERRDHRGARALSKLIASGAFVALALVLGATSHDYGRAILLALLLSATGDACLLSLRRVPFLLGIGAFLLAHLGYAVAFLQRPLDVVSLAVVAAIATLAGLAMLRWLWPHLDRPFRIAVVAYVGVLVAMLALGTATCVPLIAVGALAFAVSDVSVARDRFVAPGVINRAWGLPLYYAAQLLLAWSVAA